MRSNVVAVCCALCLGCNQAPTEDVMRVKTRLGELDVDFTDGDTRGEWWPCDARLTTSGCIGDAHVNVLLGLPVFRDLGEFGGDRCVDNGQASGAFEILQTRVFNNQDARIPEDLSAFILVGSDINGDGFIAVDDDAETKGIARVVSGTILVFLLESFDTPFAFRLTGTTDNGDDVDVTFMGDMTVPAQVPALEGPETCR